jgi:hypothetical protein
MTTRTKTGLEILMASAVIGLLGNLLLRQIPWGLNAFLFVTAFVAGLLMLTKRHRPKMLTKSTIALTGAMVFFASMFLIRDAEEILVWDTFAILVLMGVLLLGNFDIKAHVAGAFHYAIGFIWSGITSVIGPFVLLGADIDWKEMPGNKISKNVFSVLRGLAIAAPLLLIFGGLFMAADAAFEGMINRAFNFNIDTVISHIVITSVFAWLTAGYFRGSLMPFAPSVGSPHASKGSSLSITNADTPQAETRPAGSVPPEAETRPVGRVSDVTEKTPDPDTSSFVAKVVAEPGEQATMLPNNATVLEHINISDPPNPIEAVAEKNSPPYEGGVDAASADGVVLPAINEKPTYPTRDWQNLDSSKLSPVFTLGTVETVIILGLVDLLFIAFVAVQVPYLFGGMDLVQNTPDFKLAEYARRGFGELVAVAALVLPMLLLSHWLLRKDAKAVGPVYKVLAGLQILLLFVVMASAVQRLILLTGELGYGMTTVRFYPMVFMTWLAVVFAWFAVTVLREKRNHFAWGALWSAVLVLGATNLLNPDAFIARTNLQLMERGRSFDVYYNSRLSDDAVPTLIEHFEKLDSDSAIVMYGELQQRACDKRRETDIRSWNYSRSNAADLFNAVNLKAGNCDRYHGD